MVLMAGKGRAECLRICAGVLAPAGLAVLLILHLAGCGNDGAPPILTVDPPEIQLAQDDSSGAFTIRNAGGGMLHWDLRSDAPWALPEIDRGVTAAEERVGFAILDDSLAAGPAVARIAIASDGGADTVRIRPWPLLQASPDTLRFADSLLYGAIVLENSGSVSLSWSAGTDQPWIALDRTAGLLAAPRETLHVTVTRAGFPQGLYTGGVRVGAGAYGEDTVGVIMFVGLAGTLQGQVYHSDTRMPIEGVSVRLADLGDVTDALGRYLLTGVPAGTRWLRAEKAGYTSYGAAITMTEEGLVHDLELFSGLYRHRVGGALTNSAGNAIARAQVVLMNPDGSTSQITGTTDTQGHYLLEGIPAGLRAIRWTHGLYQDSTRLVQVDGDAAGIDGQLRARALPPPFIPDGPDLARRDCRNVQVAWPERSEDTVAGYRVERAPFSLDEYADVSGLLGTTGFFEDQGPTAGAYSYRVRTVNIDGLAGEPSPAAEIVLYPWARMLSMLPSGYTPRWGHTAVLNPENRRMYLFGGTGCETGHCGEDFHDVWQVDLETFACQQVDTIGGRPSPDKRYDHTAILDEPRGRMVIFGGRSLRDQDGMSDTWAFDLSTMLWTQLDVGGPAPPQRWGHAGVYDALDDRMIIHGGRSGANALADVWAFDLAAERWTLIRPGTPGGPGEQPAGRGDHGFAWVDEPGRRWLVVFGGAADAFTVHQDTWAFDLDGLRWVPLPDAPGLIADPGVIYDANHHRLLAWGGRNPLTGLPETEMYALELDPDPRWNVLDDGLEPYVPPARFGHAAVYDRDGRGMVISAGNLPVESVLGDDVWSFCLSE
jgi:hypothetical protein